MTPHFHTSRRLFIAGLILLAQATLLMAQDKTEEGNKAAASAVLKVFCEEFVSITPGRGPFPQSFEMGSAEGKASEQPRHTVRFDYEFQMAKYEVPQNLYEAVMEKNPSVWGGPRNSVEMVTFRDAEAFCAKATQLLREAKLIEADEIVRLPSEAEWEYCCRAGTNTAYCFGDKAQAEGDEGLKATRLDKFAWHTGNAAGNDPPVGALKANDWGLYDMHGYLWEYVSDGWHADYRNAPNDGGSWEPNQQGLPRVIRGGSWREPFGLLTSATRWPIPDHARSDAIGFRCVLAKD
jgi:formylglycine-generating enzyme required for sulfatase activity